MDLIKYTVRSGNTLFAISQFFQTTVSDILKYNNIQDPNDIKAGQVLLIPAGSVSNNSNGYYVTRPGDTLWTIAQRNGTTVSKLNELNNLNNPNVIYPGQIIKIR